MVFVAHLENGFNAKDKSAGVPHFSFLRSRPWRTPRGFWRVSGGGWAAESGSARW